MSTLAINARFPYQLHNMIELRLSVLPFVVNIQWK